MATAKKAKASGKAAATTTGGSTLTVRASRNAKIVKIVLELERAFKQAGCPTCRSGKERIVFEDVVVKNIK